MLDLIHLRTFVVLGATRNFTRTAAELGYSQASITHHIKMLEKEFGARLFDRSRFSRGTDLTAIGRRAYKHANQILLLAEKAKADIANRK
jgi:DNA-binding transcriptional LysR family regulator